MKGIGGELAYLINVPSHMYDHAQPDEYRIPPHGGEIAYDWSRQDG
jgi:hypothetical protein